MTRVRIVLLLFAVLCFSACHRDDSGIGVDFSVLPNLGHRFIPASELDYDLSQHPMAVQAKRDASSIDGIGMLRGLTDALTCNSIHQVSGIYNSVDAYGKEVWLSGAIYYPRSGAIKGIIVSCHYTVCGDFEVPSQSCFMDAWLATKGYAVVMPDYMGYGSTVDSIHPYMQADLTAYHVIDMALAVRPYFAQEKLTILTDEIYLMGYSQGAHAAVHALRVLEDNYKYSKYKTAQLGVKHCFLGGGPYYPSDFYRRAVQNNYISIPCGVPMLVLGMKMGWNKQPLDEYCATYFSERTMANYQDWILSKRYTVDQLSVAMATSELSDLLTDQACDLNSVPASTLYEYMRTKHDVPSSFIPKSPLWIFHSKDDEIINISYAEKFKRQLDEAHANVSYDMDNYGVHGMAFVRFLLKIYDKL